MSEYVKYIGTSHIREISVEDWETVKVFDQDGLRWDAANGWTVPRGQISDNAWPYIEADPELVLLKEESK